MSYKKTSDFVDVGAILRLYVSKWYLFVISVICCVAIGWLACRVFKQKTGIRANVLVQVDEANPLSNFGSLGDLLGSGGRVDDEIYLISAHSLYRDVAEDLGINQLHFIRRGFLLNDLVYPNVPLRIETSRELADTLRYTLTIRVDVNKKGKADIVVTGRGKKLAKAKGVTLPYTIETSLGDFTVVPTEYFPKGETLTDKIVFRGYHNAAEMLARDIATSIASKKSNVIELGINTPNGEYGKDVLNDIIRLYNKRGIDTKKVQGEHTSQFIKERLDMLHSELTVSEQRIQAYKEAHGLTDVKSDVERQALKRSEIEKELLVAETQAEIIKLTRDFLANPGNAYQLAPSPSDNNPGLQSSIKDYNDLVLKRMEIKGSVRDGNVALAQLDAQLDAMRDNILVSANKAYESAMITVRDLRAQKASSDNEVTNYPTREREYIDLQRQFQVMQQLYEFLLQRNEESAILMANSVPKASLIDQAYALAKPIGPGSKLILALAFLIGLCLPPVYLYLKKLLRSKYENRKDLEHDILPAVIGEICTSKEGKELVVTETSATPVVELFRLLRSNLQFILNNKGDKVVLVTSSRSGEGKSFISVNLAASIALLGNKRVALVGMDIRKPQLANYLGLRSTPGLTQYLTSDDYTLGDLIQNVSGSTMDVIVSGPIPPNPSEILASARVDELFETLRERYDYIIVDSAPIGMVSDSFALNRISDATIIVTRVNHTTVSDVNFVNDVADSKRLKKISVVINGTRANHGYGYGYGSTSSK